MDRWMATDSLKRKEAEVTNNEEIENESEASMSQIPHKETKKRRVKRKYYESYLTLGFSYTGPEDEPLPVCVCCYEALANESMKPSNLRRHLDTKHGEFKSKPVEFFQSKLHEYSTSKKVMESTSTGGATAKAVEVLYRVSRIIAKKGMPRTLGEEVVLPAIKETVGVMLGDKARKQMDLIPLSDNTVQRRIEEMASNVKDQLISQIKASRFFALQLDEVILLSSHATTAVVEEDVRQVDVNSNELSAEMAPPHPDHDYAELPPPLEEQLKEAHKIINDQAELIAHLQTKQFLLSRFQGDDKNIMFFTGFPDYNTLKAVFMALQPTAENMAQVDISAKKR
ncbi:zinc finger BED domain-containing protein 5-like [Sander vitreus]